MKKNFRQWVAMMMVGVASVTFTGCFGSFELARKVHKWNSEVSDAKFVNELVFLGLWILPVYEFAVLGDLLIFNTIEFWEGTDPLAMEPGETATETVEYAGTTYTVEKSLNHVAITNETTAMTSEFQYFEENDSWYLMNGADKAQLVKSGKKMLKLTK